MKSFRNANPERVSDALDLLSNRGAEAAGGGSDLLGLIKDGLVTPEVLVNLKAVEGLDGVDERTDAIRIGGLVTLAELARHARIRRLYPVLAEAAESVGTPQIRNVGTLAGNICQRPWCWYLRQGFPCYKNGGDLCFSWMGENQFNAIFGGGPSYIVHPSDTAPALVALGAQIHMEGASGQRWVPAEAFFTLPDRDVSKENVLEPGEIVTAVVIPRPEGTTSRYVKILDREAWTHAVVSVAAVLRVEGEVCRDARIVLGGVAPIPWRLPEVEAMLRGERLTAELAASAGRRAVEGAEPLSKNAYKVKLTENLVRRTLSEMAG